MSYQAGVSTGPNDLIDKLRIFLLAEGWTVNLFAAIGAGYRLHVQKTAADATVMYFNFRSAINEKGPTLITEDNNVNEGYGNVTGLVVNGSTGYDVGEDWDTQTGCSRDEANKSFGMCMSPMSTTAIPAYYFFTVDDTVNIAVEVTAGKFQFMSFGLLVKQGTITGGQFFSASFASYSPYYDWLAAGTGGSAMSAPQYFSASTGGNKKGAVYVDVDSTAGWRASQGSSTPDIMFPCVVGNKGNYNTVSQSGLCSFFWSHAPSSYNAMSAMCLIYTLLKRADENYSLIGWPAGVRFLNVTNYGPAEEITYGAETWTVFQADSLSIAPSNMYCGFAFKKVV